MERINIFIIDSGVNINHSAFKNDDLKGFSYSTTGISNNFEDEYGHGTAVYGIIRKVKDIANITNIKINSIEKGIEENILFDLLDYISTNFHPDIINLSCGLNICENLNKFNQICNKLTNKGTIIVSAFDNAGAISYPAAFNNVIGVTTGHFCNNVNEFEYIEDSIVNIAAKGSIQRLAWIKPEYILLGGNSFACAHVTVQIAKYLAEGLKTKEKILNKFKVNAVKIYTVKEGNYECKIPFSIKKAAIFPFNKEMHSLIRFYDMLSFEIADIYDSKYSAFVGSTTTHLLNDPTLKEFTIKSISYIEWDNFDTLILGHLDKLSNLTNNNKLVYNLIKKAIENKKNVYAFDDISKLGINNENIYYPKVNDSNLPPNRFGMLYRISKPVLGVFGTSSQQGKFTLQMKIRRCLQKRGFKVGQIGTEPSSLLYGLDYVYPMGYNSSVYIKEFDAIRYLNYIINQLCLVNKDIIIVGSQSGTLPYDTGNLALFNIPQYNFLLGTQPDAVILCVRNEESSKIH